MYFHAGMLGENGGLPRCAWDVIAVSSSSPQTCDAYVSILEEKQRRAEGKDAASIDERTAIVSIPILKAVDTARAGHFSTQLSSLQKFYRLDQEKRPFFPHPFIISTFLF